MGGPADLTVRHIAQLRHLLMEIHVNTHGPCHTRAVPGSSRLDAMMSPDPKPSRSKKGSRTTLTKPAAWRERRPNVLEDLLRLVGRQHLEEFAHNRDLIGPRHGSADDISYLDR